MAAAELRAAPAASMPFTPAAKRAWMPQRLSEVEGRFRNEVIPWFAVLLPVRACRCFRHRRSRGRGADQARAASRLQRRQDRLQLPRRPLGRQRGRHRRASRQRSHGARHLSALFAGRQVDRLLVESLRQQRRVRDSRGGRRREAADVPQRQRRSGRMEPRRQERRVPRLARARRVPERRDAAHDRDRRRTGTAAADRLGLVGQLLARRQVAGLQSPSVDVVAPSLSRQLRRRSRG